MHLNNSYNDALEKIIYYLVVLIAAMIPFGRIYLAEISVFVFVIWLIKSAFLFPKIELKSNSFFLLLIIFFLLWELLNSFINYNLIEFKYDYKHVGFIIFPLVFLTNKYIKSKITTIFYVFIGSSLLLSIYLFCKNLKLNYTYSAFTNLAEIYWIFPIMSFSLLFSVYFVLFSKIKNVLMLLVFYFSIFFVGYAMYFSYSRRILLSILLSLSFLILIKIFKTKSIRLKLFYLFIIVAMSLCFSLNKRVITKIDNYGLYDVRLELWKAGIKVVTSSAKNFIFGQGLKLSSDAYEKEIASNPELSSNLIKIGVHNDFLQIVMIDGLVGLFLFLLIFCYSLVNSLRKRNYLMLSFIIAFSTHFMFQSHYFDFRNGKFAFFFLFLLVYLLNDDEIFFKHISSSLRKKILFLTIGDSLNPSTYYRLIKCLEQKPNIYFKNYRIKSSFFQKFPLIICSLFFDTIFVQKKILYKYEIKLLKIFSDRLIFDFDDAIYLSEKKNAIERFKYQVKKSDVVIVNTFFLRKQIEDIQQNVEILTTPVDVEKYMINKLNKDIKIIGWLGTANNLKYLEKIEVCLKKILEENQYLNFLIISSEKPRFKTNISYKFIKFERETYIEYLRTFDIGLMPLVNNEHTLGKGGYKMLQYMAVSAIPVGSAVGFNNEIIQDGQNGYLCQRNEDFYYKINQILALSLTEIDEIRNNAFRTVNKRYNFNNYYKKWLEIVCS